jgi:hypothetical protein
MEYKEVNRWLRVACLAIFTFVLFFVHWPSPHSPIKHHTYYWVSVPECRFYPEYDGEMLRYYNEHGEQIGRVWHCSNESPWNAFSVDCSEGTLYIDYETRAEAIKKIEDTCR